MRRARTPNLKIGPWPTLASRSTCRWLGMHRHEGRAAAMHAHVAAAPATSIWTARVHVSVRTTGGCTGIRKPGMPVDPSVHAVPEAV